MTDLRIEFDSLCTTFSKRVYFKSHRTESDFSLFTGRSKGSRDNDKTKIQVASFADFHTHSILHQLWRPGRNFLYVANSNIPHFAYRYTIGVQKKSIRFYVRESSINNAFASGILNVFAAPGTITTNLLVSNHLALLRSFSLTLLAYAAFSLVKIFIGISRDLDEEKSPKKDKTKKLISNFAVIAVSYFANIGLYILINKGVRMVYTSDLDLSATDPPLRGTFEDLNMWGNWHCQAKARMFVGLVFIALAFVSIPVYKLVVGYRRKT